MIILELRFPAGRFHATPWGRHVNEGAIEWPPSPWRLLRSLIATWHLKANTDVSMKTLRALIGTLATHAPQFHLPRATNGHTRHYLPIIEGKNEKTTKVFDTFIQLSPNESVLIAWDLDLPADQLTALQILAHRLGYFGRAESLVEARLRDDIEVNAVPLAENTPLPPGTELVRLLAPLTPAKYDSWRTAFKIENTPPDSESTKKKTKSKKAKGAEIPSDLFHALHADTGDLQAAGWNLPPGAALVNYSRPANALAPAPRTPRKDRLSEPTVARYEIVSTVQPRITHAVSVADRVHRSLCKWSDQGQGSSQVFTGKDTEGRPLPGHRHAHVFCETNGPRDAITHITVWARQGFDDAARLALRRLNKVWGHEGHDIRLVLIGIGEPASFPDCTFFSTSRTWRSLTPFISTRHVKTFRDGRPKTDETNGWPIGSAAHDLLRFLGLDPRTAGAVIRQEKVITLPNQRTLRSLQFQTQRPRGEGSRGNGNAGSFVIEFPKPLTGPFALGYGAHFGLGLFVPAMKGPHHAQSQH